MAALRVLILELRDIVWAEAYARAHLPPSEYGALLRVVLNPGLHGEPRYADAVYLAAAMGERLDATELLQALPPGMPLCAAAGMLTPLLRDRLSRRRTGQLAKALRRSLLVSACAAVHAAGRRCLLVSEERACPGCHLRLGSRVFVAAMRGDVEVLCLHCWRKHHKGEKEQQLLPQQHTGQSSGRAAAQNST